MTIELSTFETVIYGLVPPLVHDTRCVPPFTDFTTYSSLNLIAFVSLPNRDMRQMVKQSSVCKMFRISTNLLAACAARSGTP